MRGARIGLALAAVLGWAATAAAAEAPPPAQKWSFEGVFGTFDRAALQRGYQVYDQVCSSCHSMRLLSFRNLGALGYGEDQIKAIAAEHEVRVLDEMGEWTYRPAKPSDPFPSPFPTEEAARQANNGALPPDLSVMTKAREGGADYVHAFLTGYAEAPPDVEVREGLFFNTYFPGQQTAMPPPLAEGMVEYADGTPATVDRMARDVTVFLSWAAEPELEDRKRLGIKVLLYLVVLTAMLYAVKRKVWADVH